MNQPNNLSSRPNTILRIAIHKHLSAALPADIRGNLGKLARGALALDLERLLSNLVLEQARGIAPAPQHKRRIRLLRADNRLLDILVQRRLDSRHEARAHVHAARAEAQRRREPVAICKAARGNKGDLERLARLAEEDEIGNVALADVAGALEAVDAQKVDAQLDGALRVADRGALVQDCDVGLFQLCDDGAR